MIPREVLDAVPEGGSVKIPHEGCSSSEALSIRNSLEGYIWHCFKCQESGIILHHDSVAERAKRKRILEAETEALRDYSLPKDFSHQIPPRGLAWLGKAGWTLGMISKYNIGYSEILDRVILPMQVGYTARAIYRKPKYLECAPADSLWFSHCQGTKIVLTEDILSAGRVGEITGACALGGTSLSTAQIARLKNYKEIIFWLDPDKAGEFGTRKGLTRLSMFTKTRVIQEKEPKHCTNEEIKELLCT